MTLAVILLNIFFVVSRAQAVATPNQTSSSTPSQPTTATSTQDQANQNQSVPSQTSQSKTNPQSSQTQKKPAAVSAKKHSTSAAVAEHKNNQKVKIEAVNCTPAPATGTSGTGDTKSSTNSATSTQASAPTETTPAAGTASQSNCPPPKVIVPEGSTPEASIQLAGGPADPPARDNAKQLLQSTEDNLKKIEGQQLTSNQRDMVTQVRQFVVQSKKATEAGDLESARTLAWKAQTLSQELVTPENK